MRLNPFSKKKPELPRSPDGTFAVKRPAAEPVQSGATLPKQVEQEIKTFSLIGELVTGLDNMVTKRQEALQSMLPVEAEEAGMLENILPILEFLSPAIMPYVPAIMEKLGLKASDNSVAAQPASASSPAADGGTDILGYLEMASNTPAKLIKPVLPKLNSELEKRGIKPDVFQRAIKNLSKAYES